MNDTIEDPWSFRVAGNIFRRAANSKNEEPLQAAITEFEVINRDGSGFTMRWVKSEDEYRDGESAILTAAQWSAAVKIATELYEDFRAHPRRVPRLKWPLHYVSPANNYPSMIREIRANNLASSLPVDIQEVARTLGKRLPLGSPALSHDQIMRLIRERDLPRE